MKHKVGDKVFIKGKVINNSQFGECRVEILNAPDDDVRYMWFKDEDLEEPGSEITAEEAWELARKLVVLPEEGGYSGEEMNEIFGYRFAHEIYENNTLTEAKEKIDAWEESQNIKVGDIVKDAWDRFAVVTFIESSSKIAIMYYDGDTLESTNIDKFKKTGKRIDIESFLKQISE